MSFVRLCPAARVRRPSKARNVVPTSLAVRCTDRGTTTASALRADRATLIAPVRCASFGRRATGTAVRRPGLISRDARRHQSHGLRWLKISRRTRQHRLLDPRRGGGESVLSVRSSPAQSVPPQLSQPLPLPPQPSQLFVSQSLRDTVLSQVRGEFQQDLEAVRSILARLSGLPLPSAPPPALPVGPTQPVQQMPALYPQQFVARPQLTPQVPQVLPDLGLIPDEDLLLDSTWAPPEDTPPPAQPIYSQPSRRWGGALPGCQRHPCSSQQT